MGTTLPIKNRRDISRIKEYYLKAKDNPINYLIYHALKNGVSPAVIKKI